MSRLAAILFAAVLLPLAGCITGFYQSTDVGEFQGRGQLEWTGPNKFIFRPDPKDPLRFVRKSKESIPVGEMFTDGGSVPSVFWSLRNYSPWWYGPAYLVHDWIFHVHVCKLPNDKYSFDESATILAEAMKTLMVTNKELEPNAFVLYTVHEGVLTPIAKSIWDSTTCVMPPTPPQSELDAAKALRATVDDRFVVDFDFSKH